MHDAVELDPVAIRKALVAHHAKRTPFEKAWLETTGRKPSDVDRGPHSEDLLSFMVRHFRAAYGNHQGARLGCCSFPEYGEPGADKRPVSDFRMRDYETCRSGDDCARPATRGRFGRMWCEYHASELERLAVLFQRDTHFRDPRSDSGNRSIVGGRSRAA